MNLGRVASRQDEADRSSQVSYRLAKYGDSAEARTFLFVQCAAFALTVVVLAGVRPEILGWVLVPSARRIKEQLNPWYRFDSCARPKKAGGRRKYPRDPHPALPLPATPDLYTNHGLVCPV